MVRALAGDSTMTSDVVPGSAHDAYTWEVQQSVDKRVPRPAGEVSLAERPPSLPETPPRDTMERLATLPFVAQPGESWVYGYNTDILGCVVERASGVPLDQFIQSRITGPLGMREVIWPADPQGYNQGWGGDSAIKSLFPYEYVSARDADGHGGDERRVGRRQRDPLHRLVDARLGDHHGVRVVRRHHHAVFAVEEQAGVDELARPQGAIAIGKGGLERDRAGAGIEIVYQFITFQAGHIKGHFIKAVSLIRISLVKRFRTNFKF